MTNVLEFVKVREGLFLNKLAVQRPAPTTTTVTRTVPVDNSGGALITALVDVSGSMRYELEAVKADVTKKIKAARSGDRFTIGWFSGPHGDNGILVQGASADTDKDKEALIRSVNSLQIRGLTCFAEVLEKFKGIVESLSVYDLPHALLFFTDGYPTDGYPTSRILTALKAVAPKIDSSLFVGYGSYFQRSLMAEMAEASNGQVVQAQDMPTFSQHFTTLIEEVREIATKTKVTAPFYEESLGGLFSVRGKAITMLARDSDRQTEVSVPRRGEGVVYGFTQTPALGAVEAHYDVDDSSDPMVKGLYAGALILNQKMKTDLAVEVVGALGDKAIVDTLANAFTTADYGRAESRLARAVERKDGRFRTGRKLNCVPDRNAFSVIDLVDLLLMDEDAKFYPYHPEFKYTKIGPPSIPKPGYPEFEPDDNPSCPVSTLAWNKTELNLSIQLNIPGHVKLDKDHNKFGFGESYPTHVFRNYSLIVSGNVNAPRLPVSMSETTFNKLKAQSVVSGDWKANEPILIDVSELPAMNRAMADNYPSIIPACDDVVRELEIQARLKVLGHYLDELQPKGPKQMLTAEQVNYLEKHGIGFNGFSPPKAEGEATDVRRAKEFHIKIASFGTLPSLQKARDAFDKAKAKGKGLDTLNPSNKMIMANILSYESARANNTDKGILIWLEGGISHLKEELRSLRSRLQRMKMAWVLGNRWPKECTNQEDLEINHKGYDLTFARREIDIPL